MSLTHLRRKNAGPHTGLYDAEVPMPITVRDRERTLQLTSDVTVLHAPSRLVSETRVEFREAALDLVSRAALLHLTTVTIDLGGTEEIDASGLGILVLTQRRARDHDITIRLVGVHAAVRQLMELTRLDYLFHIPG